MGFASGIIGELQKLSLERKLERVLYSVPRNWTCDETFETLEEFKQNYMNRFEREDNLLWSGSWMRKKEL